GCRSRRRAVSTTSPWTNSWHGNATSTAMASPACGPLAIKSIAIPMLGGADMPQEPRTAILRRRIELYSHCICDGIDTAPSSEFAQTITEAEDELLMLTAESAFRHNATAHANR